MHLIDVFVLLKNQLDLSLAVEHPVPAFYEILSDLILINSHVPFDLRERHRLGNYLVELNVIQVEKSLEQDARLGDIVRVANQILIQGEDGLQLLLLALLGLNPLLKEGDEITIDLLLT